MAGSFHPGNGRPGRQQDRAQAAGNAASRFRPLLYARRQCHHHGPDRGRHQRRRGRRRILPGAQEGGRHRQRTARRRARPLFQRRVRRHLHHPAFDQRRRLQLSGTEALRDRGTRHAADDTGRREGSDPRGPARENLYRPFLQGPRRARPDIQRPAQCDRRSEQCRLCRLCRHRHALGAHLSRRRRHQGRGHPRAAAEGGRPDHPAWRHRDRYLRAGRSLCKEIPIQRPRQRPDRRRHGKGLQRHGRRQGSGGDLRSL